MLYRVFSRFNDGFGILVFVIYLIAFILAAALIFIFPPAALVLVFIGLVGVVVVWAIMLVTRTCERSLARKQIAQGRCPLCSGSVAKITGPGDPDFLHSCDQCAQQYEMDGRRYQWDDMDEGEHESAPL